MHVADQSERNALRIQALYEALKNTDAGAAMACYAEDAYFEDIGFRLRGRRAIGRMWSLVCDAERLEVKFSDISAEGNRGQGFWVARYPPIIARPSRKQDKRFEVCNASHSAFLFSADGLIAEHRDTCDPKAWAAQAFPFPLSTLMGNVGFLRRLLAGAKLARHSRLHPD